MAQKEMCSDEGSESRWWRDDGQEDTEDKAGYR